MEALKKNQIHTAEITGYTSEGAGIARIGGMVVFVKGALAGEVCRVRILKATKNVAYGKVEELLSPSPHRVEPACPVFYKCGGCALMHMDYEEELAFKRQKVQDALTRIGGLDLEVSAIHGSPRLQGYRNKAIFAVGGQPGQPVTGFFRERSHDVIAVEDCRIQADAANRAAAAVRRWMAAAKVAPYDETTHTGAVRHVFCRYAFLGGGAQVTIVSSEPHLPETDMLIQTIRDAVPETESIVLNVNRTRGNTVLAGEFYTLWGADAIRDTLCGLEFSLSPRSFYQINRDQAEALYEKALEFAALTGRETVLDLYCGTGTITLCLAKQAGRIIGAEIVPDAIRDAKENARRNGIENAEFVCADASEIAEKLRREGLRPDVICVDPPRKGLAEDVVQAITGMAPERVVYVSCDPATLARDLARFAQLGYTARRAEAFDMFPHTHHVESVALLTLSN